MDIKQVANCLNDLFPDYLDYFSAQKAEFLLNKVNMFVTDPSSTMIEVNYTHSLFSKHLENIFALKPLATSFLQYCTPTLAYIQNPNDLNDNLKARLLADAINMANRKLYRRLETLIYGLEIDLITALSGEMYERTAAANFQLVILPDETALQGVRFESNARLSLKSHNIHAVRKQLNLAKNGAIAVAPITVGMESYFCTLGFINNNEAERFPRFRFVGHMEWEFHLPGEVNSTCRMRYRQGHLMLPLNILEQEIHQKVENVFSSSAIANKITGVIVQLLKQNKGVVAVFSEPDLIQYEVQRLVKNLQRGIAPVNVIPVASGPLGQMENLNRFTEIDGAVMIDTNGDCHAFGVILDGECTNHSKGDMSRGARLNSTRTYIEWQKSKHPGSWLGIVISEDGMFDLL